MRKLLLFMAIATMGLHGCSESPKPLYIDNALTAEQIKAAILTPEVMYKMGRAGSASLSPNGESLLYTVTDYNVSENRGVTAIYIQNMKSRSVSKLTDFASNNVSPKWSSDGSVIYFLSNRSGSMQIWSMNDVGGDIRQLSSLKNGVEGFGFAPSGDKLFYVQRVEVLDLTAATIYNDMDKSKARIYDDLMVRHWDYWDNGSYLHIFVANFDGSVREGVDIIGKDAAWDTPLAPYFSMDEIAWNNAGTKLAYTCKELTGVEYALSTDSDIFVYDVNSCKTTNISKGDNNYPFVGYDKYPVWSPDDSKIAFISQEQPGYEADKQRLFVWDSESGQSTYITEQFDFHASNVAWADDNTIYFIAPMAATHQICRVDTSLAAVEVITAGDHDINAFTMSKGSAVVSMTKITMATEFFSVGLKSGELTQISQINKEIYDNIDMGRVEKRWVETTDGKQMLTWVILPPNFDADKKYPVILYCQGGPQSVVSQFWSYRWNFQLMAAQGYIVVAPNRRGLPSFGQEWLEQISGDYSGQNIKDYLSAIDDVAKEPWADETRMGCVGASYGGYSAFYLAGNHDNRFKAFISHCGIFNFDSMYGETEELFFVTADYGGNYWDKSNKVAMRSYENSPHKFVAKWNTPILIITGEQDYRIPYTQSLQAFTAARVLGIPARLVSFEDEAHQVFKPQNAMVWNREFFGWLDKYVKQ